MKKTPVIYYSVPAELISKIEQFPRIQNIIAIDWGSLRLKKFLWELINDTRNEPREGFPIEVLSALVALSIANDDFLENFGLAIDESPISEFALINWEIPKNF